MLIYLFTDFSSQSPESVSYTHLDVYKRQDVDSAITDTFRLLEEKNVLADVTTRGGIHTEDGTYYYSKSKFWKLIKYVLEEYGEAKEFSWYCDNGEPEWN